MKKSEIKLLSFLFAQELACQCFYIPGLEFQDSIIRLN
jgi:hypothetical protein